MGKIASNKTRITATVKETTIDDFRAAVKAVGLPKLFLSEVVEDALIKTTKILKLAKEKEKSFSMVDLFTLIGEELQERIDEERKDDGKKPTRKTKKMES